MKNSKGTDRKKLVRDARNACRDEDSGVGRRRSRQSSANDFLLIGPDNAPDVEQHDDAKATADTDREHVVIVLTHWCVVHEQPCASNGNHGDDDAENVSCGRLLDNGKEDCPTSNPDEQEQANRAQRD